MVLSKANLFGLLTDENKQWVIVLFSGTQNGKRTVEAGVFSRPLGSLTPPPATAGSNTMCSSCGAPLQAGERACRFCGCVVPDDVGAWNLEKISAKGASVFESANTQSP